MALTTSAILIQPTLDNVNALITVEDLTDYVGNGINLGTTQVNGYIKITLNSSTGTSVIYDNIGGATPDVDYNNSPISTSTINLPVDANGYALQGTYTIEYNVEAYLFASPNPPLYYLFKTFTYLLQQDKPVVCLAADVSCSASSITSYDTTAYGTYSSVSRVHTLYPPPASGYIPVVGIQATLSSGSPIVDKTWTQEVQSTVTYTYPNGLIFIVYVEGVREIPVVCDFGMNKIFCCLKKVFDRYNTLQTRNITAADAMYEDTVKPMLEAMVMYNAALDAGNPTSAAYYYDLTIQVSGCGEDCGCTGSTPQVVNPSAGVTNIVIVDSPDNSISVNPVIVGNTTTYEVQVSSTIQNALNALKNTVITTTTPSTLAISSNTVGNTTTYNINYVSSPTPLGYNLCEKLISINTTTTGTFPSNYLTLTKTDIVNSGANIDVPANHSVLLGQSSPNVSTDYALINVSGIFVTPTNPFTINAQIISKYNSLIPTIAFDLACEVLHCNTTTGEITIRLINPITGQPYKLSQLVVLGGGSYGNILISLTINSKI
jgi:hypothetical protein